MTEPLEQLDPSPRPSRKRRSLRIVFYGLLLILGIAFARFAWLRITLEPTPRPEYWQAQIAALDPPPTGALTKDEAARLIADRPWESKPPLTSFSQSQFDCTDALDGPWNPIDPTFAAIEKVFASDEFKTILDRMRQAARRGWLPRVDLADPFVMQSEYRRWVKWLVVHSRWEAEVNKDSEAVGEDWLAALGISRQLRRSRLLNDSLVYSACDAHVAWEMMIQASEPHGPLDIAALARRIDETLGPLLPPLQLLSGERMRDLNYVETVFVREAGNWLNVSAVAEQYSTVAMGMTPPNARPSRLWNLFSPLFYDIETAKSEVNRYYASLDACTDIATYQKIETSKPGTMIEQPPGLLSGFIRSLWDSTSFEVSDESDRNPQGLMFNHAARCELEAGITMLALREYHRRNDRYPENLEQLIPDFLPRMPIDYSDRRPLRYRTEGDRYVLYSIGLNGKDDGGKDAADNKSAGSFREENPDTVFSSMRRREAK